MAAFFAIALGYDIPFLNSSLITEVFKDALQCVALSCSSHTLIATTWGKSKPPEPIRGDLPPTPPSSQMDPPTDVGSHWPDDLDTLHPLSLSRITFAQRQRQDPWLGPLFQYLVSEQDSAVLKNLTKHVTSWVKTDASNCKIIDGLIMYADVLMDNPDHYRIFVPIVIHNYNVIFYRLMIVLWACTEGVM